MAEPHSEMAELLKSSMQFDVDTRTFLIVAMGGYTGILLLVWVFTGSHVAMVGFFVFALWNIREIDRVNVLQERLLISDFCEVMSLSTQAIIRWAYIMTVNVENRTAFAPSEAG